MNEQFATVGSIPAMLEMLTVDIMEATVVVRHEEREDVSVQANYPEHWAVGANGTIRQTAVRQFVSDVRVVVQYHSLSLGEMFAALLRRLFRRVPTTSAEVPAQVQPAAPAPAGKPQLGPDSVLILVPIKFAAGLDLNVEGSSACTVDHWGAGSVRINYNSSDKLSFGDIKAPGPFFIEVTSDAEAEVGDVECDSIKSSFTGDGSIKLGNWTCRGDFNLTQENSTDITAGELRGGNVTIDLNGDYAVKTLDITAGGHLTLLRNGDGEMTVGRLQSASVKFEANGDGSLTLGDIACEGEVDLDQENSTDMTVGDITGGAVNIDLNGDYSFTAGNIAAANKLHFNRYGDGSLKVASLKGEVIETGFFGDGSHAVGSIEGGAVKVDHNDGDADIEIETVKSTSFDLAHCSDYSVTIGRLETTSVNLNCEGSGDVTVKAGSAQSGRLYNGGDLSLSVTGCFGYLSHKNEGDGSIEVEVTA